MHWAPYLHKSTGGAPPPALYAWAVGGACGIVQRLGTAYPLPILTIATLI